MTRPVGLSRDLPEGRVMGAEVDGVDLAIWRNSQGAVAAWNNRCPHRGMRLSHGFVRGDQLACLYHGWRYDASGRCRYIPAHPDLDPPATICTTTYSVVEQGGVIWVSVDGPAKASQPVETWQPLRSFLCTSSEARLAEQPQEPDVQLLFNPLKCGDTWVIARVSDRADLARRKVLSRWCESLRQRAEAP